MQPAAAAEVLRARVRAMFGPATTHLPVRRLPQLIKALEAELGLALLASDELASLEAFAEEAADADELQLAEDEMLNLLMQMMPPSSAASSVSAPASAEPAVEADASPASPPEGARSLPPAASSSSSMPPSPSSPASGSGPSFFVSPPPGPTSSSTEADGSGSPPSSAPAAAGMAAQPTRSASSPAAAAAAQSLTAGPSLIPRPKAAPTSCSPTTPPGPPSSSPAPPAAGRPPSPVRPSTAWERFSKPAAPSRRRSKRVSADGSLVGRGLARGPVGEGEVEALEARAGRGASLPPPSTANMTTTTTTRGADEQANTPLRSSTLDPEGAAPIGGGERGSTPTPPPTFANLGPPPPVVAGGGGGGRRVRKARQASYELGLRSGAGGSASVPLLVGPLGVVVGVGESLSPAAEMAGSRGASPSIEEGSQPVAVAHSSSVAASSSSSSSYAADNAAADGQEATYPPAPLLRSLTSPSAWSAEADFARDLPPFGSGARSLDADASSSNGDNSDGEDGEGKGGRSHSHFHELSIGSDGAEGAGEDASSFPLTAAGGLNGISGGRATTPNGGVRRSRPSSTTTTTMSTASSLTSLHDALTQTDRLNGDLSRSLAAARRELEARAADYELQAAELLARLDELKGELAGSRREEKELRQREAAGLRQIAAFEAEIASLHKALDRARASHSALVKVHHEQMQATERLRNVVRERDREALDARETVDGLRADADKWAEDQRFLESTQARLLAELDLAREAETYLEQQKVENLSLKETINRLRADLDELRLATAAAAAAGGGRAAASGGSAVGMSRGPSGLGVEEGTLGRSLEKELLRELRAAGREGGFGGSGVIDDDDDDDDDAANAGEDDDGYIETFITTSRRRIRGERPSSAPKVTVLEQALRAFEDVGTQVEVAPAPPPKPAGVELSVQTDESALAGLPAYSPRESIDAANTDDDDEEDALAADLALRRRQGLHRKSRSAPGPRAGAGAMHSLYSSLQQAPGRRGKAESEADRQDAGVSSLAGLLGQHGAALTALGLALFIAGLQLGTAHVPFAAGGLPTDGRAWATYNDLARTQGAGIGFSPAGSSPIGWVRELLGLGAAAAGLTARVPT